MSCTENYTEYEIPTWSLCYIEYGDMEGIEENEIEDIEKFMKPFKGKGHWSFGEEEEFCYHPAFGLGCMCVKGTFVWTE